MHEIEADIMRKLNSKNYNNFPKLIFDGKYKTKQFFILERFG